MKIKMLKLIVLMQCSLLLSKNLIASDEFSGFKSVLNYTLDRIYCAGETGGDFNTGIKSGLEKLNELLEIADYDPTVDLDEEGNNPLHLVAKHGLFEFYKVLKELKQFNVLRESVNHHGQTPLDLASLSEKLVFIWFCPQALKNVFVMIPRLVTEKYYRASYPKLVLSMTEDACPKHKSVRDMYLAMSEMFIKMLSDQCVEDENSETENNEWQNQSMRYQEILKSSFQAINQEDEDDPKKILNFVMNDIVKRKAELLEFSKFIEKIEKILFIGYDLSQVSMAHLLNDRFPPDTLNWRLYKLYTSIRSNFSFSR